MGVDRKSRSIILSIKAKDSDEEAEALEGYRASATGGTTLGDLLKEQMENTH
jgi:small subunit ribosomal protein S1